jgi:hypothetical protein
MGSLKYEAGTRPNIDHNYSRIWYSQSFSSRPVVFTQVTSSIEQTAVVTRTRDVDTTSFMIRIQEEESNDNKHQMEDLAYLAIEPGKTFVDGKTLEVGTTGTVVDDNWETIQFAHSYTEPVFLADDQTVKGSDPVSMRLDNLDSTSVRVFMEEEKSGDSEDWHVDEDVGYLVCENSEEPGQEHTKFTADAMPPASNSTDDMVKTQSDSSTVDSTRSDKQGIDAIQEQVSVYPNPTGGEFIVETGLLDTRVSELQIVRMSGGLIYKSDDVSSRIRIDLSGEPAGIYLLELKLEGQQYEWKIIKR